MLTEVAKNIYKKAVPLPNNPLREINAYIITGEKNLFFAGDKRLYYYRRKNLLIDIGFNRM